MTPASGRMAPAMALISVDLPAPFSPTRHTISPARTSRETPLSARTPAKDFSTPSQTSSGSGITPPKRVEQRRGENDGSFRHQNREIRNAEQVECVIDQCDEQRTERSPQNLAGSAEQAGAADDNSRDHVQ